MHRYLPSYLEYKAQGVPLITGQICAGIYQARIRGGEAEQWMENIERETALY